MVERGGLVDVGGAVRPVEELALCSFNARSFVK